MFSLYVLAKNIISIFYKKEVASCLPSFQLANGGVVIRKCPHPLNFARKPTSCRFIQLSNVKKKSKLHTFPLDYFLKKVMDNGVLFYKNIDRLKTHTSCFSRNGL